MTKFLIQMGIDQPFYLDGFDGIDYEWTPNRKEAWHLSLREAEDKLARIRNIFPNAIMLKA